MATRKTESKPEIQRSKFLHGKSQAIKALAYKFAGNLPESIALAIGKGGDSKSFVGYCSEIGRGRAINWQGPDMAGYLPKGLEYRGGNLFVLSKAAEESAE